MAEVASAYVSLIPSARGFGRATSAQIGPQMTKTGALAGAGLGRSLLKGFLVVGALTKITQFVGDALSEARDAEKVTALVNNAIEATGGVAGVSADQVNRLADAFSRKTGVDDEQIASSAALLLTFKNVRREGSGLSNIFNRATRASIDLSTAGFGSMDSTAKQLGKALNDPIKGLSALGRAGVTFTAAQTARIKGFVAEGRLLAAQKVLLREVESQVGGATEATVTYADKSRVALNNIKEQIGTALLPALDGMGRIFTTRIAPAISGFITNLQNGTGSSGRFAAFIQNTVVPALRSYYTWIFTKVVPAIRNGLVPVIASGRRAFTQIAAAVQRNEPELRQMLGAVKAVANFVLTKALPTMLQFGRVVLPALGFAIKALINTAAFWVNAFNAARVTVQRVATGVEKAGFVVALTAKKMVAAFKAIPDQLYAIGVQIVGGLVNGIRAARGLVLAAVQSLVNLIPGKIRDIMGISSPSKVTTELGRNIADGLARGIESGAKKVSETTQRLVDKLKGQLSTLKGEFSSIKDAVAGAFTGNLFEAATAGEFITNLLGTRGQLTSLKGAFSTLLGWGFKPEFLSQLFSSGNGGLILDLAAGGKDQAVQASTLLGDVQSLSTSLGADVARADVGPKIDKTNDKLDKILAELKSHPERNGREFNRPAGNARRRARVA